MSKLSLVENAKRWPPVDSRHAHAVERVLASRNLTCGRETEAFEEEFAAWLGAEDAVMVSSGTASLVAALLALGVGQGHRVLVPALGFAATPLAVEAVGAEVVWGDVDPETFNLTGEAVRLSRAQPHVSTVVGVDLHGLPISEDVRAACQEAGYLLLEDAAQAYGGFLHGQACGTLGDAGAFSLNESKTLWAGEGGIVTGSAYTLGLVREWRRFGVGSSVSPLRLLKTKTFGTNGKATEMQAALARVSLLDLDLRLDQARIAASVLSAGLEGSWLTPPPVPAGSEHSWHKYRVRWERDWMPQQFVDRAAAVGVPAYLWQTAPLPAHPHWRAYAPPGAIAALERSACLGSEDVPLCAVEVDEAKTWAERLANLEENL